MDLDVSGLTEAEAARYRWMMERGSYRDPGC